MSYNINTAYAWIMLMGQPFQAEIDYEVTDWGSDEIVDYKYGGDPGWPPEWDIKSITLREDKDDDLGPPFKATGALFRMLANKSKKIEEAVCEQIAEY